MLYNNNATYQGGAIVLLEYSTAKHQGNSKVRFVNNICLHGGAIYCQFNPNFTFHEESEQ